VQQTWTGLLLIGVFFPTVLACVSFLPFLPVFSFIFFFLPLPPPRSPDRLLAPFKESTGVILFLQTVFLTYAVLQPQRVPDLFLSGKPFTSYADFFFFLFLFPPFCVKCFPLPATIGTSSLGPFLSFAVHFPMVHLHGRYRPPSV